MKVKNPGFSKIFWLNLLICVGNAIFLVSIPGEKQNTGLFGLSILRLLLLVAIILPVVFLFIATRLTKPDILRKYRRPIDQFGNGLAAFILLTGFFFILMPFTKLRITIDSATWLRLLPVFITYVSIALIWVIHSAVSNHKKVEQSDISTSRESFIDFTRGFAIVIAISSHAFFAFGYGNIFGEWQYLIKSFTRFGTPLFIMITGMMFEIVYLKRAQKNGLNATAKSLLKRAAQCYFAYLITVLVEWFNHLLSNQEAIHSALFIGKSLFSGILQFYVLFLLLAIAIIWLRQKAGILPIVFLPIVVWVGDLLLDRMVWPVARSPLSYLTGLVFGHPSISSFSVWHAITFMSQGMLLAYLLKQAREKANWKSFQVAIGGLFVLNLLVTLAAVYPANFQEVVFHFANDYRDNHQLAYYSIGSMGALLMLWLFWLIRNQLNKRILDISFTSLGKDSLWAFAVGNSLDALLPVLNYRLSTVFLFVAAVWAGSVGVIYYKNHLKMVSKKS
ncbi:MAG: OpgC domain-containing protein [Anaerolineaceae bacterium]